MRLWAVQIRYLESKYTGDGKWHSHTTSWHLERKDAWIEAEEYQNSFNYNWDECGATLIHKETEDGKRSIRRSVKATI